MIPKDKALRMSSWVQKGSEAVKGNNLYSLSSSFVQRGPKNPSIKETIVLFNFSIVDIALLWAGVYEDTILSIRDPLLSLN